MQSSTDVVLKTVVKVLQEDRLRVPPHQRPFEWTEDQVRDLIEDLDTALTEAEDEYFLGSIVCTRSEDGDAKIVLDGQQRLACATLILAAIATELEKQGDKKRPSAIRSTCLHGLEISSGEDQPRLVLSDTDESYFRKLLEDPGQLPAKSAPASHFLLQEASKQLRAWIVRRASGAGGSTQLVKLYEFLEKHVNVVYFQVSDDSDAYKIFETLNDRGLDLSIADLLKNYVLGRVGGSHEGEVLLRWSQMIGRLDAQGQSQTFTEFLRHYWLSKHEVIRERELYRRVKKTVSTKSDAQALSLELFDSSLQYAAISNPAHDYWVGFPDELRGRLRTLGVLGLDQYKPLLLAALATLKSEQCSELARMLVNWNVRLLIVGGGGGGVMEEQYSKLAKQVRSCMLKDAKAIAKAAIAFIPSDATFQGEFERVRVSKAQLARYYLSALERTAGTGSELIPNPEASLLSLEHVLPEKPEKNWPQFSSEEHRLYYKRLGNLALLSTKLNSDARSKAFNDKRPTFSASSLKLTQMIGDAKEWNRESIAERQAKLAALALTAWPLT